MNRQKITVFDFETTGFKENRAVSLGMVIYEDGQKVAEIYQMFQPGVAIEPGAQRVHGLSARDVQGKPTFAQMWLAILPYLENHVIVAHNAKFDLGVLARECAAANLQCPPLQTFCTLTYAKQHVQTPSRKHNLGVLAEYYDIDLTNAHNALDDSRATGELLFKMVTTPITPVWWTCQ
ncbi:MAG: 3'-5' exonuclease [Culicoidibacterales bacterium]